MKKVLFLLLVMLCLVPGVLAEDTCSIKLEIDLSQTIMNGPEEVTVTIMVTNVSGEDMPVTLALYAPDGRIIKEFGTPTLMAGESQTWKGTWAVTESQLDQGKVVFAVRYTCQDALGDLYTKTQSYYVPVWRTVIELKGNPTTGYSWQCVPANGHELVKVVSQYVQEWQSEGDADIPLSGNGGKYRFALSGIAPGEETITFTYKRIWEDNPALYTLVYHVRVDDDLNVTILSSGFDW